MPRKQFPGAEQYTKQNKRRRAWQKIVSVLACIVVFCTTYALILPAITMEKATACAMEEHKHAVECYEQVVSEEATGIECTLLNHTHTDACIDDTNTFICGNDAIILHEHVSSCRNEAGELLCPLEERFAHVHDDSCYAPAETEPPHVHDDTCYTMEPGDLTCELEVSEGHAHSEACYIPGENLVCQLEASEGHTHGAGCSVQTLTCTLSTEPSHTHDTSCYQSKLVCTQEEVAATSYEEEVSETVLACESTEEGHVHDETLCYQTNITTRTVEVPGHTHGEGCYASELTCGLSEEAHVHGETCYRSDITCTIPESEGHAHAAGCYEQLLSCELPLSEGHAHGDACYAQNPVLTCEIVTEPDPTEETTQPELVLVCTAQELIPHTHTDACVITETPCTLPEVVLHAHGSDCFTTVEVPADTTTLTCGQEESAGHTHTDSCRNEAGEVICGQTETPGHTHSALCYGVWNLICEQEEHTHDTACYSDPTADVETAAQWEATFSHVTLTGDWNKDVLAIAETQLGYAESAKNYAVWEDGSTHGYTRYGAWYGSPYGDWCAMFVSFCLNYAEVEGMPLNWGVRPWIEELTELELYHIAAEYTPKSGDLVFFDWEGDGLSDHVGLVAELIEATENAPAQVKTIEGNSNNCVQYVYYDLDDPVLLGYSELPEPVREVDYFCGLDEHTHSTGCYDEAGNLICALTEHSHTEECLIPPVTYYCGLDEHIHAESCYDEAGTLICVLTEHTHTGECTAAPTTYLCGREEHVHGDDCYVLGILLCDLEEHTHTVLCQADLSGLSEEDRAKVERVILLIDAMPSADEIDAKIAEFEAAEDYEGEEAWLTEIYQQVGDVYFDYMLLGETLQAYVVNADKLMELEYIWSAQILIEDITWKDPTPIGYASTKDFIELNLYDYNGNVNTNYNSDKDWPGFQWNGGAYHKSGEAYSRGAIDFIDFGNSMITDRDYAGSGNGKATTAWNIGNQGGNINAIVEYPSDDYANKPVGMSNGTEVLGRNLTVAGYPWVTNAGSMVDYFSNSSFATKKNTASIDGLFQKNEVTGEYYYNSRWNHAQYGNNKFTLYNNIITPNFITYPFGNFLPFNDITSNVNATNVGNISYGKMGDYVQEVINDLWYDSSLRNQSTGAWYDATAQQLVDMLAKYRSDLQSVTTSGGTAWTTWSAKDAIYDYIGNGPTDDTGPITDALLAKMYNIDWDVDTNFFFGMEMKMNFMQPKDGYTGNDTNGDGESDYPMIFYFTGDDDVWVYIDGALFLDLSGIHRHVGGEIDFVNGKVHYYALSPATGDVSTTPYVTYTFAELLSAAGKSTDGLNEKGTFKDYTTHKFNFYYMERGSGSSVCRLNFNFPLLLQNSISVSKEVSADTKILGNPSYRFQVLKADSSGNKTNELFIAANTKYTIYNSNDVEIGTGETDANGVFTLKAGQRAEFTGIKENAGKYYVRELLEGTVLEQYGNVTVSGESTTTSGNVTVGTDTFTGMDSPVKDMSDGATAFRFTNDVDETKLGSLSISKQLTEYTTALAEKTFDIEVTLDGVKLPVGTAYTVAGATRTVATEGIITIAAGEKAELGKVLAGTEFTVKESTDSAAGYIVTYTTEDGYTIEQVSDGVKGIIKVTADVQLIVNNREKGTVIQIPGTKSLSAYDGAKHTYEFELVEVTDAKGSTVKDTTVSSYVESVTITDAAQEFAFAIAYVEVDMEKLSQTFYYRITEKQKDDTLSNNTAYVVQVDVTLGEDGGPAAAITNMWKGTMVDGAPANLMLCTTNSADFLNTLKGDLTLEKTVEGSSAGEGFNFEVKLLKGDSGVDIQTTYPVTLYQASGEVVERTPWSFENGVAQFNKVMDGEKFVIHDLPYGTIWQITEVNANGYKVTTTVTVGDADAPTDVPQDAASATVTTGSVTVGSTHVHYTNTYLYELPETGGPGNQWYIMAGLLLMTISCGFLMYITQAKRRKEGQTSF